MTNEENADFDQSMSDWAITEEMFRESGLETTAAEAENNDFLRNFNAIGRYLASIDAPVVQYARFHDQQTIIVFDEEEPVELPSPFVPADDDKQMWVIRNKAIDDLESTAFDAPQISSITAYGYNQTEKMMLFNLEQQRYLGINGTDAFSAAMVRGLAVEHIMEPWNESRVVYFVGFGVFGVALKQKLESYHSNIRVTEKLTDLEYNAETLNDATIFCLGHDAQTLAEFIKTTTDFNLAVVANTQLGGTFTFYQEGDDDGAVEPGNIWLQPFLLEEDSEEYAAVINGYEEPAAEDLSEEPSNDPAEQTSAPATAETDSTADRIESITDDELHRWLESAPETTGKGSITADMAPAPAPTPVAEEPETPAPAEEPQQPAAEEPAMPNGYLQLMADKPLLVAHDGTTQGGFSAQVIAYTYFQQTYGDTAPTFAELCRMVWQAEPTGKDKSKLSARRKRAVAQLAEFIPDAELTLAREGWSLTNLTTDIDLLKTNPSQVTPGPVLPSEPWATKYRTDAEKDIADARQA